MMFVMYAGVMYAGVMYAECRIQALDAECRYAECLDPGQMSVGLMVFGQKRCYPESLFQVIIAARASQLPANNISNPFFKKKTFFLFVIRRNIDSVQNS